MEPDITATPELHTPSPYRASDISAVLIARGWLNESSLCSGSDAFGEWCDRAATLLGPHAPGLDDLAALLDLIARYDAQEILARPESHAVLVREGARDVLRELAAMLLDGPEVDSDRYKQIITALKERTGRRGQELFHPIRLALAGRAGEGELDRVILLLDSAARLGFQQPVKSNRKRILEFCGAME